MSTTRIVHIPAMTFRIEEAASDADAIYQAHKRAHHLVHGSATVIQEPSVSDENMALTCDNRSKSTSVTPAVAGVVSG